MQFYIIDTVGIQPTQQLVLQLDGGRFYWTACDFTLMIQLESNQRNSWCSNWTEGDFTLLRRRETALLGKGKSMSNNVNSHFPTGQEAREVGRPDSGFGRPGFRVWATRASGRACSEHGVGTWSGTHPVKPLHEGSIAGVSSRRLSQRLAGLWRPRTGVPA